MSAFAHALVSADWLAQRLGDETMRVLAVHTESGLYEAGHIPGAQPLRPVRDLRSSEAQDVIDRKDLIAVLSPKGVHSGTTVVVYDDVDGRLACYVLWVLRLRGPADVRLLDGGLRAWTQSGYETRNGGASLVEHGYFHDPSPPGLPIRATRQDVLAHLEAGEAFVDARMPAEFAGVLTNRPDAPQEGILRGGHLPGALSIPHARALWPDGTFKDQAALGKIYAGEHSLDSDALVIVYSRTGPRACLTWFVLAHQLGFRAARVYDGGWAEWGNLVGVPIERGGHN